MDATPQLVAGAALTMRVRNPLVAFGVGMASHVVLDSVPHFHAAWIMGLSRLAVLDVALGTCLALMVVAVAPAPWGSLMGALGGMFPEIERLASGQRYDFLERPPFSFPHTAIGLPWGVMTQAAAVIAALALAARLRRDR